MTFKTLDVIVGKQLDAYPLVEGPNLSFNGPSFDILMCSSGIEHRHILEWTSGEIFSSAVVVSFVPFLYIKIGKAWNICLPFNILHQEEEIRRNFFESDPSANIVTLILADFPDPMVRVIRITALDLGKLGVIREACFDQLSVFQSAEECDQAIKNIVMNESFNCPAG